MECIYLDHNATTPIRPEVVDAMTRVYRGGHANPASQHRPGQQAHHLLEQARESIARIVGANLTTSQPDQLIFTSGGTESNNLAVFGLAAQRQTKALPTPAQPSLVISALEHPSVVGAAEHLLDQGWRLDTLGANSDGVVRAEQLPALLTDQTRLVSVMLGNHDTGVLQPVAQLAAVCRQAGVPMHTDAVQVVGKMPVDFRALGVTAMSVAAHKFQGPAGIGALVVEHGVKLAPMLFGGHQQGGIRPGTEPVALAVGMATALELWQQEHEAQARRITALRDRFEGLLREGYPALVVNGLAGPRLPQTSSIAFPGLDAQILLMALDMAGVACSVGAACSSGSTELSPTLRAMGLPKTIVASSLRFSLGATTTESQVDEAARRILHVVRELSPPE